MLIKCVFDGNENVQCSCSLSLFSYHSLAHKNKARSSSSHSRALFLSMSTAIIIENLYTNTHSTATVFRVYVVRFVFFCILYPFLMTSSHPFNSRQKPYTQRGGRENGRTGELKPFPFDSHSYLRICTLRNRSNGIYIFGMATELNDIFHNFLYAVLSLPLTYMNAIPCSFNRFAFAHQRIGLSLNFQHFQIYAF